MKRRLRSIALAGIGLAVGLVAVVALREATLSTHQPVPTGSTTEIVVRARTRGGEVGQTLGEMVEAHVLSCRLEVGSDVLGQVHEHGERQFSMVLAPGLDMTNRRQLRGCIEDFAQDHLQVDVLAISDDH